MSPYIVGGLGLILAVSLGVSHVTAYRHGKHVSEGETATELLKAEAKARDAVQRVEAARRDRALAQAKAIQNLNAAIRKGKIYVENNPRPACRPGADLRGVLDAAVDAANRTE